MSIGERLRIVADVVGGVKSLAELWGMASPGLYAYFNNRTKPGAEVLLRLHEIGFSIEWLLAGEGSMYARNAAGEQLRHAKAATLTPDPLLDPGSRLRAFAGSSFSDTAYFAQALGKSRKEVELYFSNKKQPPLAVLQVIARLGCNINWLLSGEGPMNQSPDGEADVRAALLYETQHSFLVEVKLARGKLSMREVEASTPTVGAQPRNAAKRKTAGSKPKASGRRKPKEKTKPLNKSGKTTRSKKT